jgi:hypothetical protein
MSIPLPPAPDVLAGLRPYRLPDPVAWWPPAPGWWLLALLAIGLAAALVLILRRRRRCRAAVRAARAELARLRALAARADSAGEALPGLSRLLRRYALAVYPREQVAGLSGPDWLQFLDAHGGDGRFAAGPGRALAEAPYRPPGDSDLGALFELVGDWIRRNPGACR